MRKTSVTARMLASKAPLMTPDGLVLTGHTSSRILRLDLGNGRIVDHAEPKLQNLHFANLADLTNRKKTILIGKTDYIVRAYDEHTGFERVIRHSFIYHDYLCS